MPAGNVAVVICSPVTVKVKYCTAWGLMPLFATKPIWKVPALVGVPDSVSPEKVTPPGSVPEAVIVGVGLPVAVTVNDPADPTVKVVEDAEVIVGRRPDRQGEGLASRSGSRRSMALIVIGKDPPCVGVTRQGGGPVTVVDEADTARQGARLRQRLQSGRPRSSR